MPMVLVNLGSAWFRGIDQTHELIANLLGVRRGGITGAAGKLQQAGVICDRRGCITVLDRAGLQEGVCAALLSGRRRL